MTAYVPFAELRIGQEFAKEPFTVERESVIAFIEATIDSESTQADAFVDRTPVTVPWMYAAVYNLHASRSIPAPPGGILAKRRFEFHQSVEVGDVVTTSLRIVDLYMKRGRNYVVVEGQTYRQDGAHLTTTLTTRVWAK